MESQTKKQDDSLLSIQSLLEYLRENEIDGCRGSESARFIPISKVKDYFKNQQTLKQLVHSLEPDKGLQFNLEYVQKNFIIVVCILTRISKGSYLAHFTKHISLSDQKLPFTSIPADFPITTNDNATLFEEFCKAQWAFCAPRMTFGMNAALNDDYILPFVKSRHHANGGTAEVLQISIHEDYDDLRPRKNRSEAQAHVYALKTMKADHRDSKYYFDNEMRAFAMLRAQHRRDTHIIDVYGGFQHCNTYNVMIELAAGGTLDDYFCTHTPPKQARDILDFWRSILGLGAALVSIHETENMHGWHQDIKPANILFVGGDTVSEYKLSFKVSDFGLSRFVPAVSNGTVQPPFSRDAGGTDEFGAPERSRADDFQHSSAPIISQAPDVWAFGCVLSIVATWVCLSFDGVKAYEEQRWKSSRRSGTSSHTGTFHDGVAALPLVNLQHRKLLRAVQRDDVVTPAIVKDLIKEMLKDQKDRLTAWQVHSHGQRILEQAERQLERLEEQAELQLERPEEFQHAYDEPLSQSSHDRSSSQPQLPHVPKPLTIPRTQRPLPELTVAAAKDHVINNSLSELDTKGLLKDLEKRDHVFLVDNSETMDPHWSSVQALTTLLFEIVKGYDPDGVDFYFTASSDKKYKLRTKQKVQDKLAKEKPKTSLCHMENRLGFILQDYQKRLYRAHTSIFYRALYTRKLRPLNVYIMTDGQWQDGSDPDGAIKSLVEKIKETGKLKSQVGLQFISFGNDAESIKRMERLDDKLGAAMDIVDTEPSVGNVWKMLLGAVNAWFDGSLANDVGSPTSTTSQFQPMCA